MTETDHRDSENESSGEADLETGSGEAGKTRLTRRQQRLAKVVGFAVATAFGLLAAEIILRLYWQPPEYSFFPRYALAPDKYTGARYRPNLDLRITYGDDTLARDERFHFSTNSMGFRSRELPSKKAAGVFRVLFVGDSFTEGFGVNDDETFPHYFEQVARQLELPVEVINAGQNATDFPEYVAFLRGYAKRLQPDLVVLSLYAGNDIPVEGPPNPPPRFAMSYGFRVSKAYENRVRGIRPGKSGAQKQKELWILIRKPGSFGARADRWLHRRSLLYRLSTEQIVFRIGPVRGLLKALGWIEVVPDKKPEVFGGAHAQMFLTEPQPDVERVTRESREQLLEIERICDEMDVPLFVQVVPYIPSLTRFEQLWEWFAGEQWPALWEKRLGRPPAPGDYDKRLPNQRILDMVREAGLPHVDLARLHERAARFDEFHQLTFRAKHGHFTPDENLFDAGVLMHELLSRELLPGEEPASAQALTALELIWRTRYPDVRLPYFEPTTTTIPGAPMLIDGFEAGRVASSLDGISANPRAYVKEGFFSPVFNVQPEARKVSEGDHLEYHLPLPETAGRRKRVVIVDICRPATDGELDKAVRQSIQAGRHEFWYSELEADRQGRWLTLELPLPFASEATTLTVRVEATRDIEAAYSGEFPFLLRLRRLRVCEIEDGARF